MGRFNYEAYEYRNKLKQRRLNQNRFYCKTCRKLCQTENGFKCHVNSKSHQFWLIPIMDDNARQYLEEFSYEFENCFLHLFNRKFANKTVDANVVFQEFIRDKTHIDLRGTKWKSLSRFIKYLKETGKVVAEQTDKGWYITSIDKDQND